MRRLFFTALVASFALLFCVLPAARADVVQLYFTGTTSGGDWDPYKMLISPVGADPKTGYVAWLNCDDHYDYIQAGESWQANVIHGSDDGQLTSTQMSLRNGWSLAQAQRAYDANAYIELHYSSANNPYYSNAIWAIFEPGILIPGNPLYAAAIAAADADSGTNYLTYRQHLTIYSYVPGTPIQKQYGSYLPQEFNTVPDGGLTVMLLGCALAGLETMRRRFGA